MITYSIISKPGEREVNEDSLDILESNTLFLFALADGLGGHGHGCEASSLAVSHAVSAAETCQDPEKNLVQCFLNAQQAIMQQQAQRNLSAEMKTTMVCLHLEGDTARWGHVGDSRLYMFRGGRLFFQTKDHSVPQILVSSGEISEKDIRGHEDRNRLIRVLGMEWTSPKYELSQPVKLKKGDAFLLCSDGFWEWIVEGGMQKSLRKASSPADWLAHMEDIVLKNGRGKNMDNYSAIAIMYQGAVSNGYSEMSSRTLLR